MKSQKLLIVEDNPDVREDLRFILEAAGYHVVEGSDGPSAVAAAQRENPSLIICDIGLGAGMDGFDVLAAVRRGPFPHTPFLFLSARDSHADMRKAMQTGADDYLTKPYTGPELLAAVAAGLERGNSQGTVSEIPPDLPGAWSALMIRVDRFHYMENLLGSDERQELISEIEDRIRSVSSLFVKRVDLNEFLVILPEAGTQETVETSSRIMSALRKPAGVGKRFINLAVNAGLCPGRPDLSDRERIRRSEIALQHALDRGAPVVVFREDLLAGALGELDIQNALVHALSRGEFEAWFQPQFRSSDLSLCGREALIRWKHPEHGMISPARFIPIAETTGLIRDIDHWMLRESSLALIKSGAAGWLSVNLSAREIEDARIVEKISRVLAETGLDPSRLDLEITESCIMRNQEQALHRLHSLKGLGVSLSVDDFGTGYSSLAYLKDLPIDRVKIDRAFVIDVERNDSSKHIIRTIVGLAEKLNLEVVAEGVETAEQVQIVRDLGCHILQGYYLGKPAPALGGPAGT